MPRLFVAIDMPDAVKDRLEALAYGLPGARWSPRDQMHLTLRFVGDVDGGDFEDLRAALGEISLPAFEMRLRGLGHFPPRGEPHVLWAGVPRTDELVRLQSAVEKAVRRIGVPAEERKFHPHVTLARLKGTPSRRVGEWLVGNGLFEVAAFPVTDFALYSSVLGSAGAHHELEESYPLVGGESEEAPGAGG
jgi:2'-5' RNA ligase